MKKLVLLFTGVLITLTTVTAAEQITATQKGEDFNIARYSYAQPIMFVERGVEFLIFPDGSFDFNTNLDYSQGDSYYRTRTPRRNTMNATFGAPGTRVQFATPRRPSGVIVTHDRDGKVRRIGNLFVNYNKYNQVKRLGSVYIQYNRFGMVKQVGGLSIRYDRGGNIVDIYGHVNYSSQTCNICGTNSCTINHFNGNGYWNFDQNNTTADEDFYYYKKGDKTVKQKKIKTETSKK